MNLPHLDPLIFAKKIIELDGNIAKVLCEFDKIPTLCMFIEASAQASSAFDTSGKIAFLTVSKNIDLIQKITKNIYVIQVTLMVEIENMKQFYFEVFENDCNKKVVSGNFTILIQK
jgi:ABC-type antimicrobial peptide transport system ATPase subunit